MALYKSTPAYQAYIQAKSRGAAVIEDPEPKGKVINLGSDTFGNPNFSKGLTKLAIFPDYKCPGWICLALPPGQKFGLILVIKFF